MGISSVYPWVLLIINVAYHVCGKPNRAPNLLSQTPFLAMWNAPTAQCLSQYGVDLDLSEFSIIQNHNQIFMGGNVTIFYEDKLGLYPRYFQGVPVHGGVPQNASLDEHLRTAAENIRTSIPDRDFEGLAVIDWESWRPVWERNWDSKQIYLEASKKLVRAQHPDWKPSQVEVVAREQFERAGRAFMEDTLKLGQRDRPQGLWGFYGFPDCYNNYNSKSIYTGQCPLIEMKRNDQLSWLWNASSALYPDIYLTQEMRWLGDVVRLYAQHRILEAMRVGEQATPAAPPVLPYARIVYTYSLEFLTQEHLIYTIGESAALGSAGVVLWGDHTFAETMASCEAVKDYIDETLGHYLVNVTSAATLCSQTLCSFKGRCQRKDPKSRAYLHLDATSWTVVSEKNTSRGRSYRVLGQVKTGELEYMEAHFQCKCYPGWGGASCSSPLRG